MTDQETIIKSHFLPDHEVKGFTTVSKLQVFEDKGTNLLDQVSEAIKAPDSSKTKSVSSIPTMFARPLLFKMALFDKNHPLHKDITDEWRGLMSCFILAQQLQLKIEFKEVKYNAKSKFFKAYNNLKLNPEKLGRNEPGSQIEYEWTKPFLIIVHVFIGNNQQQMVIGGTSPATLFYTSPNYSVVAKSLKQKGVSVVTKENDDLTVFSQPQSDEHLLIVYKWLNKMIGDNGRIRNAFSDEEAIEKIKGDIIGLFTDWEKDIKKIIDAKGLQIGEQIANLEVPADDEIELFPFPLADYRLFRLASAPLVAKHENTKSDLFLQASNLSGDRIIICDESLNIAGDLIIYNNIKKSNVGEWHKIFKGAIGDTIGGQKLADGVNWIVPGRYFLSNELVSVKSGKPFVRSIKQDRPTDGTGYEISGGESYILPFTREFLDLYGSSEEIIENLSPAFADKDGKVEFSFNLKIKYLGKVVDIRVRKCYTQKPNNEEGQIVEVEGPPLLAIWPHFYHENWERYFIYKRKVIRSGEREFDFEPYKFGSEPVGITDASEFENYDVLEIKRFPEAMLVKYKSQPIGCILLKRYTVQDNIDIRFGVDFGTSNTNLWYSQNTNNLAEVLDITVMPRVLTENNNNAITLNLASSFFPYETPKIPFATVVKQLIPGAKKPILEGMIQFVSENLDSNDKLLETNIKWGGNTAIRELFVEHMLLLICAEARTRGANKISLNVSYPLAYSNTIREAYIKSFSDLVEKKFKWYGDSGCITVNFESESSIDTFTESVAVGKYFAKTIASAKITGGAICVDVGGGTSDISIWFNKSIVYQSSLYLAGNLISNSFRKSNSLRRVVFQDLDDKKDVLVELLAKSIKNNNIEDDDSFFAATFNLLLKKYGHSVDRRLPTLFNDPTYNQFRTILIVEFASIIFYCGMVIQKLRIDDHSKLTQMLNLYWAGGASAFVKWIDYGSKMHSKSASYLIFSEILKSFYYTKEEKSIPGFKAALPESELTKNPKSECAYGLLVNEKNVGDSIAAGSAILGERIRLNSNTGQIIDHTAELNARKGGLPDDILGVIDIDTVNENQDEDEDPGLTFYSRFYGFVTEKNGVLEPSELGSMLNLFVKILNLLGKNFGLMGPIKLEDYPHLATNIKSQIREAALRAADKTDDEAKGKTVRVEPIFIIEVKELIKEMIKKLN